MKVCRVDVQLYLFLTLAVDASEYQIYTAANLPSGQRSLVPIE
jgi:hypothetical protein